MRSRLGRLGPVLAFVAGAAVAFPLVTRPSILGPVCSRTGATGAIIRLEVVSATRDGIPVTVPQTFTPYIQNTSSSDASRLLTRLVDVGDRADSTPTFPERTIRRLP